jgi:hypothetical protein
VAWSPGRRSRSLYYYTLEDFNVEVLELGRRRAAYERLRQGFEATRDFDGLERAKTELAEFTAAVTSHLEDLRLNVREEAEARLEAEYAELARELRARRAFKVQSAEDEHAEYLAMLEASHKRQVAEFEKEAQERQARARPKPSPLVASLRETCERLVVLEEYREAKWFQEEADEEEARREREFAKSFRVRFTMPALVRLKTQQEQQLELARDAHAAQLRAIAGEFNDAETLRERRYAKARGLLQTQLQESLSRLCVPEFHVDRRSLSNFKSPLDDGDRSNFGASSQQQQQQRSRPSSPTSKADGAGGGGSRPRLLDLTSSLFSPYVPPQSPPQANPISPYATSPYLMGPAAAPAITTSSSAGSLSPSQKWSRRPTTPSSQGRKLVMPRPRSPSPTNKHRPPWQDIKLTPLTYTNDLPRNALLMSERERYLEEKSASKATPRPASPLQRPARQQQQQQQQQSPRRPTPQRSAPYRHLRAHDDDQE